MKSKQCEVKVLRKKQSEVNENLRSQATEISKKESKFETRSSRQEEQSMKATHDNIQTSANKQRQQFKTEEHTPTQTQKFESQPTETAVSSSPSSNQKKVRNDFMEQEQEKERLTEELKTHEEQVFNHELQQEQQFNISENNSQSIVYDTTSGDLSTPTGGSSYNSASSSNMGKTVSNTSPVFSNSNNKVTKQSSENKFNKKMDSQTTQSNNEFTKQKVNFNTTSNSASSSNNYSNGSNKVTKQSSTNKFTKKINNQTIQSNSEFTKQQGNQKTNFKTSFETKSSKQNKQTSKQFTSAETPIKTKGNSKLKLAKGHLKKGTVATASMGGYTVVKGGEHLKQQFEKANEDEAVQATLQGATLANKAIKKGGTGAKKISAKTAEKLRNRKHKKLENKKDSPLTKEKKKEVPLKKGSKKESPLIKKKQNPLKKGSDTIRKPLVAASSITGEGIKKGVRRGADALATEDEAIKAVKNGTLAAQRTGKVLGKGVQGAKKLKISAQKLSRIKSRKGEQLTKAQKKKLFQKKKFKKNVRSKNAKKASAITNKGFKAVAQKAKLLLLKMKAAIGAKLALALGSSMTVILPIILIITLFLIIVSMLGAVTSPQYDETAHVSIGGSKNLSPNVERWRDLVTREANAQGMGDYVDLLLAIIQVESGGTGTADIMQSSESAGYDRPNVWATPEQSVRQGVKHLKTIVNISKSYGKGYESNVKLLAQAYNFGNYFAHFVGKLGGEYTIEVAEKYSREVVAPSLGNKIGAKYSYVNEVSTALGKPYLYTNGGNFMYGDLVGQYLGGGAGANISGEFGAVLKQLERFEGWPYSWGGKNPQQGFDCSGLTTWGLAQMGINIPSYTVSQWDMTYPVSPSEARPGDLVFFKGTYGGPNFVSHVGFYVNENTMYDSNGSGIGYHNFKDPYWAKHYAGIRRVKGQ